jgi:hypothetical protein
MSAGRENQEDDDSIPPFFLLGSLGVAGYYYMTQRGEGGGGGDNGDDGIVAKPKSPISFSEARSPASGKLEVGVTVSNAASETTPLSGDVTISPGGNAENAVIPVDLQPGEKVTISAGWNTLNPGERTVTAEAEFGSASTTVNIQGVLPAINLSNLQVESPAPGALDATVEASNPSDISAITDEVVFSPSHPDLREVQDTLALGKDETVTITAGWALNSGGDVTVEVTSPDGTLSGSATVQEVTTGGELTITNFGLTSSNGEVYASATVENVSSTSGVDGRVTFFTPNDSATNLENRKKSVNVGPGGTTTVEASWLSPEGWVQMVANSTPGDNSNGQVQVQKPNPFFDNGEPLGDLQVTQRLTEWNDTGRIDGVYYTEDEIEKYGQEWDQV